MIGLNFICTVQADLVSASQAYVLKYVHDKYSILVSYIAMLSIRKFRSVILERRVK